MERLVSILQGGARMVFFGGAGVSTESGIPDFRSEAGLYQAKSVYGHSPEELLSHSFFEREPALFFRYCRENLVHPDAKPNGAHRALAALERAGKLRAVVTQNIDGLHQAAGSRAVWELHGSMLRGRCTGCGGRRGPDYILAPAKATGDGVPLCEDCGGILRPDIVLYQEALDDGVVSGAVNAIASADVLIVGGTSLAVYPAAGLLRYFRGDHLVLLNKTPTDFDRMADLVIREPIGRVLADAMDRLTENLSERNGI